MYMHFFNLESSEEEKDKGKSRKNRTPFEHERRIENYNRIFPNVLLYFPIEIIRLLTILYKL
jgi:hypothetical protein